MTMLRALLVLLLLPSAVLAQGVGQLSPGYIWGNATSAKGPAGPSTVTSILDRALSCSANGLTLNRMSGSWACTGSPTFSGNLNVGGTITGASLKVPGSTSGTVSILSQAAAGTYNFNLPTTAGSSRQVLVSGGGGSAPMTWSDTLPVSTLIYLKSYGVVADGTTSDLASFNSAIAFANANGGNITFIVPVGTNNGCVLLDGAPTAITVNNVFFKGEGSPQNSCIKTTTFPGVTWGSTSTPVDGGGMIDVGLDGNGNVNTAAIVLPQAARMRFDNIHLRSGVAQLAVIGNVSPVTNGNQISFTRLRGIVANVGVPLITALNGSGLFVSDYDLFVSTTPFNQISGRHFIAFSQGSWDTANISNGVVQLFDSPLVVVALSGQVIQNIKMFGTFNDQNLGGPYSNAVSGGSTYAIELSDNEITALGGGDICFQTIGVGTQIGIKLHHNRLLQCNLDGVSISAATTTFSIQDNDIYGVNRAAATANGITVASGATNGVISGNKIGVSTGVAQLFGVPTYGMSIGNVSNTLIEGNLSFGSTAGCSIGTLTSSKIRGNSGYTAGAADTSCIDQPALSVAEGGTSGTISGDATLAANGALTVRKVNGVSYGAAPSTSTVPVVTGTNTVTYEAVPNAALANSATTVNGQTCTLGSTCTVAAAAGTLTGATLASGVTGSSLTSVGTIATGVWNAGAVTSSAAVTATTTLKSGAVAVASLPTCNAAAEGTHYGVTDANAATFHTVAAGGGTNHVAVYCNGTSWFIGG